MVERQTHIQGRIELAVTRQHGFGVQRLRNTFARMMEVSSPDALDLHLQLALMNLGDLLTIPDQHTRDYYAASFTWFAEDVMEIRKRGREGQLPTYFSTPSEVVQALDTLHQDPAWARHRTEQLEDLSVDCQGAHSYAFLTGQMSKA